MSDLAFQIMQDEARREKECARLRQHAADLQAQLERAHAEFAKALRDMRTERAELHTKINKRFEEATVALSEAASARRAFYNLQERLERQEALVRCLLTAVWEGSDTEVADAAYKLQAAMKVTPSS